MKSNEKIIKELIDKMFELGGYEFKYEDMLGRKDDWFNQYTMTQGQHDEWMEWGTKLLKKKRIMRANEEMGWLSLMCGLKIKQDGGENRITTNKNDL